MPEVLIDGVAYVPAADVENLKRWHAEALARVRQLESDMERTIKLMAKAQPTADAEVKRLRQAIQAHRDAMISKRCELAPDLKLWKTLHF